MIRLEFYRHNESSCVEPYIPSCQGSALYEVTAIYSSMFRTQVLYDSQKPYSIKILCLNC